MIIHFGRKDSLSNIWQITKVFFATKNRRYAGCLFVNLTERTLLADTAKSTRTPWGAA
jgi:hypothetical protein